MSAKLRKDIVASAKHAVFAGKEDGELVSDWKWAINRRDLSPSERLFAYLERKALRQCFSAVTFDIPSFMDARSKVEGLPVVLMPSNQSIMDHFLCFYLCLARPELGIPRPKFNAQSISALLPQLAGWLSMGGLCTPDDASSVLEKSLHKKHWADQQKYSMSLSLEQTHLEQSDACAQIIESLMTYDTRMVLLPIHISYDDFAQLAQFIHNQSIGKGLTGLFAFFRNMVKQPKSFGNVHIVCGTPTLLGPANSAERVTWRVMSNLQYARAASTYHLKSFLLYNHEKVANELSLGWLTRAIEKRHGKWFESNKTPNDSLLKLPHPPYIGYWYHCFLSEASLIQPGNIALNHFIASHNHSPMWLREAPHDEKTLLLLDCLFRPIVETYRNVLTKLLDRQKQSLSEKHFFHKNDDPHVVKCALKAACAWKLLSHDKLNNMYEVKTSNVETRQYIARSAWQLQRRLTADRGMQINNTRTNEIREAVAVI